MKQLIKRVWHPYWDWEEVKFNMWGSVDNREITTKKAIKFTGNHKLYGRYMMRVAKEWKFSCEHNLTALEQNRRAWIGHAAAALYGNIPEDITREAWHHLTDEQRTLANKVADKAITYWEKDYVKKITK